jgi:hypothetical protein
VLVFVLHVPLARDLFRFSGLRKWILLSAPSLGYSAYCAWKQLKIFGRTRIAQWR